MPKFTTTDPFGNIITYSIYKINGKEVKRRVTSATKEQIKTDPRYHAFNMSSQEMAGANIISSAIRNPNILEMFNNFKDTYVVSRLNAISRKMIKKGNGEPGFREANLVSHGHALINFPLNKERPLSHVFQAPVYAQANTSRTQVTINTAISPTYLKRFTPTSTHAVLTAMLATVSTHKNNKKSIKYKPTHPEYNALGVWKNSPPLDIKQKTDVTIQLNLPVSRELPPSTAIVVFLGITFGALQEEQFAHFKTAQAMNVIKIL